MFFSFTRIKVSSLSRSSIVPAGYRANKFLGNFTCVSCSGSFGSDCFNVSGVASNTGSDLFIDQTLSLTVITRSSGNFSMRFAVISEIYFWTILAPLIDRKTLVKIAETIISPKKNL